MVCMIQQPVLQVCKEAVEYGFQSGLFSSGKISIDSTMDKRMKLWIDKKLFTEALIDLLVFLITNSNSRNVISIGMQYNCLVISCDKQTSSADDAGMQSEYHIICSARTREIISQHRAAIDLQNNKMGQAIVVRFPTS